jgi:hypothetical protein
LPYSYVALLNDAIGLPSRYAGGRFASLDASVYLLDYNYADRTRGDACVAAIDQLRKARSLRFEDKTLLLAAQGLDPHGPALVHLARRFGRHHVFFELWNRIGEVAELACDPPDDLHFFPVTSAVDLGWIARRRGPVPNRRVFVSLGGDDDLDLVREVVRRRRDVAFYVPDLAWHKSPEIGRREFRVSIDAPNVVRVPCAPSWFTREYLNGYAICDTVLVAAGVEKIQQMRGGIRVADALRNGKALVMTRNPMCELLMAQHERTCLVAEHDPASTADALARAVDGGFGPDQALSDAIGSLTDDEAKLAYMTSAYRDPLGARRSPFWRDPAALPDALEPYPFAAVRRLPVRTLFDLRCGQRLAAGELDLRVDTIHRSGASTFELTVARIGGRPLDLQLSTTPTERYFMRTSRGHYLTYRNTQATPEENRAIAEVARHL